MTEARFAIGDDVMPIGNGYRGNVLERREIDGEGWLYGVVSTNGQVHYYVERGLKSAAGMM